MVRSLARLTLVGLFCGLCNVADSQTPLLSDDSAAIRLKIIDTVDRTVESISKDVFTRSCFSSVKVQGNVETSRCVGDLLYAASDGVFVADGNLTCRYSRGNKLETRLQQYYESGGVFYRLEYATVDGIKSPIAGTFDVGRDERLSILSIQQHARLSQLCRQFGPYDLGLTEVVRLSDGKISVDDHSYTLRRSDEYGDLAVQVSKSTGLLDRAQFIQERTNRLFATEDVGILADQRQSAFFKNLPSGLDSVAYTFNFEYNNGTLSKISKTTEEVANSAKNYLSIEHWIDEVKPIRTVEEARQFLLPVPDGTRFQSLSESDAMIDYVWKNGKIVKLIDGTAVAVANRSRFRWRWNWQTTAMLCVCAICGIAYWRYKMLSRDANSR